MMPQPQSHDWSADRDSNGSNPSSADRLFRPSLPFLFPSRNPAPIHHSSFPVLFSAQCLVQLSPTRLAVGAIHSKKPRGLREADRRDFVITIYSPSTHILLGSISYPDCGPSRISAILRSQPLEHPCSSTADPYLLLQFRELCLIAPTQHTLLSASADGRVSLWDLPPSSSDPVLLDKTRTPDDCEPTSLARVDCDRAVVGCRQRGVWLASMRTARTVSLAPLLHLEEPVLDVDYLDSTLAVCTATHIALYSLSNAVLLAQHLHGAARVHLGMMHLVVAPTRRDAWEVKVWKRAPFGLKRSILFGSGNGWARCARLVGRRTLVLSAANDDGKLRLHHVATGEKLWECKVPGTPVDVDVLPDGRVLVLTNRRSGAECFLFSLPEKVTRRFLPAIPAVIPTTEERLVEEFSQILRNSARSAGGRSGLLQYFSKVIRGDEQAGGGFRYISSSACSSSFMVWRAAHELLMIAIEEGTVEPSREDKNFKSWCMSNLYLPATSLRFRRESEKQSTIFCLRQAERCGVIDSAETIIRSLFSSDETAKGLRRLEHASLEIWEHTDSAVEDLEKQLTEYVKDRNTSLLHSIAMYIIPITGSSLTTVLGTDMDFTGLSRGDVVDYVLGYPIDRTEKDFKPVLERLFACAAVVISPSNIEAVEGERKRKLFSIISESGLTTQDLLQEFLLMAGSTPGDIIPLRVIRTTGNGVQENENGAPSNGYS